MSPKKSKTQNKQLVCVGGLALLLIISMLGFAALEDDEPQNIQAAQVSFHFGGSDVVSELVNVSEGQTAQEVFGEMGDLILDLDEMGNLVVSSVSAGNYTAAKNETHGWMLYVNGVVRVGTYVDSYKVTPGEDRFLELRFEEKLI